MTTRAPESVIRWIERDFRSALKNDDVVKATAASLQVGIDREDDPLDNLRIAIAGTVMDVAGYDPKEERERRYAHGDTCPNCKNARLSLQADEEDREGAYCHNCGVAVPTDIERCNRRDLANLIARKLFTDGIGRRAETLILNLSGGRESGGWAEGAMADQIMRLLDEAAA